jgi:hypothetical protein
MVRYSKAAGTIFLMLGEASRAGLADWWKKEDRTDPV